MKSEALARITAYMHGNVARDYGTMLALVTALILTPVSPNEGNAYGCRQMNFALRPSTQSSAEIRSTSRLTSARRSGHLTAPL